MSAIHAMLSKPQRRSSSGSPWRQVTWVLGWGQHPAQAEICWRRSGGQPINREAIQAPTGPAAR